MTRAPRRKQGGTGVAYVLPFSQCSYESVSAVGGKCASLGEMLQAAIPVPPGVAVTTGAFAFFLGETGLGGRIARRVHELDPSDLHQLEAASAEIGEWICSAAIPRALERAILDGYQELGRLSGDPNLPVAVRSSATAEDSTEFSFAGLHESYLWVRTAAEVLARTRACWASLYTPRAMAYRLQMSIGYEEMLLAVGIQQMVHARAAGVMFTLDPANGDPSIVAIEGNWGLGESVVKGEATPDRFRINKVTMEVVEHAIAQKAVEYVPDLPGGGVVQREVSPERQSEPCLSPAEAALLAAMGKRIERHYGCPQDIEWAIDHRLPFPAGLYIVQARSETYWSRHCRRVVERQRPQALGYVVDFLLRRG